MKKTLFLVITFLSVGSQELSIDGTYRLLKKIDNVEIREYKPLLFASYMSGEVENPQNSSFRVLADYIFGHNDVNEKIEMTSPVIIRLFNNNEMLFRIPERYTKKTAPKPNNKNVKLIETNYTEKAVIQYSGYSNLKKEKKKVEELKTILQKHNIKHNNKFELFVYDPPYKLFNRQNEISVIILKKDYIPFQY